MEKIVLHNVKVSGSNVLYHFNVTERLSPFFKTNELFCSFDSDMSEVPTSILCIPFVCAFGALVWIKDAIMWVPELDRTFYESFKSVKLAFQEMHYDYHFRGRLIPSKIVENILPKSNNSMLLFGGGVDAHCSYIRNIETVSHIINIQGWYADIKAQDKAADKDLNHCKGFARDNNLSFRFVKSNFASLFNSDLFNKRYKKKLNESWWHGFQHAMAFISIGIVQAYKEGISNLIIGSSNTVGDNVACASDITTDSMYGFAKTGMVIHDGYELDRQQKVGVIVNYQKIMNRPYPIEVCSFNDHNCCACEKCFRTIIEIVAEGGDIRNFNFRIEEPLHEYFPKLIEQKVGLWGIDFERKIYWSNTFRRIKENWENINEKQFCEWLLKYDFDKAKREGLRRYYRQNFFSILKRKMFKCP